MLPIFFGGSHTIDRTEGPYSFSITGDGCAKLVYKKLGKEDDTLTVWKCDHSDGYHPDGERLYLFKMLDWFFQVTAFAGMTQPQEVQDACDADQVVIVLGSWKLDVLSDGYHAWDVWDDIDVLWLESGEHLETSILEHARPAQTASPRTFP